MFIDYVKIQVKGGKGGDGCVSFRREKYVPNGGPDGGDGGKGGSVILEADRNRTNLLDFRYKRKFQAPDGADGGKSNRSGKAGADVVIKVPVGTLVREVASQKIMADLAKEGERHLLIHGGRGGRGNQHFATAARQAPQYAEKGKPAKEYEIILELKLIADVGLVGLPNAGKSSLLSMATNANPKIADYHFTTLSPNLGVVRGKEQDFVMADIPGLIEGASQGLGLGHDFLRHVERTKIFIHVVDAAALEGGDPVENVEKINRELAAYNPALLERPQVIAANKIDLPEGQVGYEKLKAVFEPRGMTVYPLSAITNLGIQALLQGVAGLLRDCPPDIVFAKNFDVYEESEESTSPVTVHKIREHLFQVEGPRLERMLGYTNLNTEKGFAFFQGYMRDQGIIRQLEALGLEDGDTVRVCELEFEYYR